MKSHVQAPDSRRRALVLCAASAAALPFAIATGQSYAQAQIVDRCGSLWMLSQRICKASCQLGLGVLPTDAETILARSLTRFTGAMVMLRESNASDAAIVRKIESDWVAFRDLVSTTPTKANYARAEGLSESILGNAEQLTAQLTTTLRIQSARFTNLSGRQRMRSQRMAKSAFAMMWGMDPRTLARQHEVAREQFVHAITELKRVPGLTLAIAQGLEMADTQFGFFDVALGNRSDLARMSPPRAMNVARSNERLLEIFDELTSQFAASSG